MVLIFVAETTSTLSFERNMQTLVQMQRVPNVENVDQRDENFCSPKQYLHTGW